MVGRLLVFVWSGIRVVWYSCGLVFVWTGITGLCAFVLQEVVRENFRAQSA